MITSSSMIGSVAGSGTANAGEALRHFVVAFTFLLLGLIMLCLNSPMLAEGAVRDAKVVAGLHFLTLGWLSLSIFGALQVFSGVALGGPPLDRRLSAVARKVWSIGIVFFIAGFLFGKKASTAAGFGFLGLGLLLYTAQIIPVLAQAKRGQITRAFIAIGFFSLWCAWILGACGGLARLGAFPTWAPLPAGYFEAHLLFAVFGWAGSMVIGVGSHLVPMFALSRGHSLLPLKVSLSMWAALPPAGILSIFFPAALAPVAWSLAALGSVAWSFQLLLFMRARLRRDRDHGLHIAAVATIFLVIAWAGLLANSILFVALAVVGWLCFFTLGIYHRVVPFLVWFARYSGAKKLAQQPKVKDLTSPEIARWVECLFGPGIVLWIGGLGLHSTHAAYAGSGLMLAGAVCTLFQLKPLLAQTTKEVRPHGTVQRSDPAAP